MAKGMKPAEPCALSTGEETPVCNATDDAAKSDTHYFCPFTNSSTQTAYCLNTVTGVCDVLSGSAEAVQAKVWTVGANTCKE